MKTLQDNITDEVIVAMRETGIPVNNDTVTIVLSEVKHLTQRNPYILDTLIELSEPEELKGIHGFFGISDLGKKKKLFHNPIKEKKKSQEHKIKSMIATGATPQQIAVQKSKNKKELKKAQTKIIRTVAIAGAVIGGVALLGSGSVVGGAKAVAGAVGSGATSALNYVAPLAGKAITSAFNKAPSQIAKMVEENVADKMAEAMVEGATPPTPAPETTTTGGGGATSSNVPTPPITDEGASTEEIKSGEPEAKGGGETKKKSKLPLIIGGSTLALIIGIFILKRKKK